MPDTCESCRFPIPPGRAVIRSVTFRRLAWHPACYEARTVIPSQRTASEKVEA